MDSEAGRLIVGHFYLVDAVVNHAATKLPNHVDRDELRSAAMIALMQAAAVYDASTGVPFRNYANLRMKGAIIDALRHMDWAPRSVRAQLRRPDLSEMEHDAIAARAALVSLDRAIDELTLLDHLPAASSNEPENVVDAAERRSELASAVAGLPTWLEYVVRRHWYDGASLRRIGDELDVSESRVSQLLAEAYGLLRHVLAA